MPNSTAGVFNIAFVAGDKMAMKVHYCLASRCTAFHSDIVAIGECSRFISSFAFIRAMSSSKISSSGVVILYDKEMTGFGYDSFFFKTAEDAFSHGFQNFSL